LILDRAAAAPPSKVAGLLGIPCFVFFIRFARPKFTLSSFRSAALNPLLSNLGPAPRSASMTILAGRSPGVSHFMPSQFFPDDPRSHLLATDSPARGMFLPLSPSSQASFGLQLLFFLLSFSPQIPSEDPFDPTDIRVRVKVL